MSTPPLFLVDSLGADERIELTGEEGRHAARVKRLTVGEHVTLGDGAGQLADGVVSAVTSDGLVVSVLRRRTAVLPEPRLVVVQALPKGERAESAVEVMTELGVDEIVPWAASRSIAQWRAERGDRALEKWRRTAREATKQSRRAWLPVIAELHSTADVAQRLQGAAGLVLHEDAADSLASVRLYSSGEVVVVVGPEGGISDDELGAFSAAGAQAVRMGSAVLRTSTAGAAALAALSVRLGRWA